ncbi:MAG TPA: RsmD family RNA methyltransferase [Candidatus Azoamicus sp. OHIO2]
MKIKKQYLKINQNIFKNKKVKINHNKNIKPSKDNIKSIFYSNIDKYKDLYTLDLFAGTGVISFDLYFKKLKKHILIEKNKKNYTVIKKIKNIIVPNKDFNIHNTDSYLWIKNFIFLNISLIIIDPPYKINNLNLYFIVLNQITFLKKYILFFLETNKKIIIKNNLLEYFLINKYQKGQTLCYLIKKI